ncbi:MAG: hypothetical protein CVU22_27200 [Betaproteobacteria bacterium HGW-Betaproteobacteria-16]|nr:MAG: hypothetical protein CVU22_27200 [Betaproteobacteria bacterium HGW-Betaproteobacteria-16]
MVSAPVPPLRILLPLLPKRKLSLVLPVALMASVPVRIMFSRLELKVKEEAELYTVSVPCPADSVILSAVLSTW